MKSYRIPHAFYFFTRSETRFRLFDSFRLDACALDLSVFENGATRNAILGRIGCQRAGYKFSPPSLLLSYIWREVA